MTTTGRRVLDQARAAVAPLLEALVDKPEVEAVVLLSSICGDLGGRRFDEWSDIDLAVYLDTPVPPELWRPDPRETADALASVLPDWLPDFSFWIRADYGPVEVNLHQSLMEYELDPRTAWPESRCEAYSGNPEIVHDRHGRLARLIEDQLRDGERRLRRRMAVLAARLQWDIEVLPERQLRRGRLLDAHAVLTAAVDELVELLYLAEGRYPPSRKWRMGELTALRVIDDEGRATLDEVIRCSCSAEDARRRSRLLAGLYTRLRPALGIPADAYDCYNREHSPSRQLRRQTGSAGYPSLFVGVRKPDLDARDRLNAERVMRKGES
ncbi:MAG: hypothetical protein HOV94_15625 [Saccharothrix sp.]|nr:hypothetical protein [Saccharothrix sp.]